MIYISKNAGKRFEEDFKSSVPSYCWYKRLNDNAASWAGGANTRFTSRNECDCLLFDDTTRTLYALELKSTKGTSFTFWRENFEDKSKKQSFMIKKNQIQGLEEWSRFKCVNAGFVFNMRSRGNNTYYVPVGELIAYTSTLDKKSINEDDILQMKPIVIENKIKRVRYGYNVGKFLQDTYIK